jgi:hypothetical protein
MIRWLMLSVALASMGCGTATLPSVRPDPIPILSKAESDRIGRAYRGALAGDPEVVGIVMSAADPELGSGWVEVRIDGRVWSTLTRAQHERVMNKMILHLRQVLSRGTTRRATLTLNLYDDLGRGLGMHFVTVPADHR